MTSSLNVLWACTGSVATVKLPTAVAELKRRGHYVRIVTTARGKTMLLGGATERYDPKQFPLLAADEVEIFHDEDEWPSEYTVGRDSVLHIELRKWADVMIIAPLSANTLAKLANGLCDNLLTCICRAWDTAKPMILAPAMNTMMWDHPFTARHLNALREFDYVHITEPIVKTLACKDTGKGAMATVADIIDHMERVVSAAAVPSTMASTLDAGDGSDASAAVSRVPFTSTVEETMLENSSQSAGHPREDVRTSSDIDGKQALMQAASPQESSVIRNDQANSPWPLSKSAPNPDARKRPFSTNEAGEANEHAKPSIPKHLLFKAAKAINNATHVFIGAGAGCSADSGLQVFAQLSKELLAAEGLTYDQIASTDFLARNPKRSIQFWLTAPYLKAQPHEGYTILSDWLARSKEAFVVTSNVDGFFPRALAQRNVNSIDVAQIHGSLSRWQCGGVANADANGFPRWKSARCCDDLFDPPVINEDITLDSVLKCPQCQEGIARPNVYMFGDGDRFAAVESVTKEEALRDWFDATQKTLTLDSQAKLVILEIGCGLRVPSVRKRCEELFIAAKRIDPSRVEFIRINPEYPEQAILSGGMPSISIRATALEALVAIEAEIARLEDEE